MELRNCRRCGQAYVYTGSRLCPECVMEDEEDFDLIRRLLEDDSDYTVKEISTRTGVSEKKIIHFLREGRLQSGKITGETGLQCRNCGKEIRGGRLCEDCAGKLKKELGERKKEEEKRDGRMYTADRFKRRRRRK